MCSHNLSLAYNQYRYTNDEKQKEIKSPCSYQILHRTCFINPLLVVEVYMYQ